MAGFIDPDEHTHARLDRLETLLAEVFQTIGPAGLVHLSPRAQLLYHDLMSEEPVRHARGVREMRRLMGEDPL